MSVSRNLIRKYRVPKKLGIASSTFALWTNPNSKYFYDDFPTEIRLGNGVVAFDLNELDAWIESRMKKKPAASDKGGK